MPFENIPDINSEEEFPSLICIYCLHLLEPTVDDNDPRPIVNAGDPIRDKNSG